MMTDHEERVRNAAKEIISGSPCGINHPCTNAGELCTCCVEHFEHIVRSVLLHIPEPSSPWVSVDERLPNDDVWLALRLRGGAWIRGKRTVAGWFRDSGAILCYPDDQITHWMPLPPLPKETDNEQD